MGELFTAADWIAGLLAAVALGMTVLTHQERTAAKVMIWIAVVLFIGRWGLWAMTLGMEQSWWVRTAVGALVGGFLLGAIPAVFSWIDGKSNGGTASAADGAPPAGQSPPSVSTTN